MHATAILVIDDEPHIRRAVKNALSSMSDRVLESGTGVAGLDLAATARPDLLILDLALPDMDAVEVCRDLRTWSRMPIIVLSARHSDDEKVELLRAGADDYITKPFSLRELEARVQVQLRCVAGDRGPPTPSPLSASHAFSPPTRNAPTALCAPLPYCSTLVRIRTADFSTRSIRERQGKRVSCTEHPGWRTTRV